MLDSIFALYIKVKKRIKNMLRDKPMQTFVLICAFIILVWVGILKFMVYAAMEGFFVYAWIGLITIMSLILALIIAYRTRLKEPVAPLIAEEKTNKKKPFFQK